MRRRTAEVLWIAGAPGRALLLAVIALYRATLSGVLGGQCRFHPTCSAYAMEAVRTHGALRGSVLAAWRVLRCSPLTAGGPDPVPARRGGGRRPSMSASYREA
ncbi:MAG TPA: membrane protein insertion efficiency factor YidD [Actinomycetota bacterium]|nr:membrane protein insertion efficiency factor YidD [Actinomycetota bacterium]